MGGVTQSLFAQKYSCESKKRPSLKTSTPFSEEFSNLLVIEVRMKLLCWHGSAGAQHPRDAVAGLLVQPELAGF